MSFRESPEQLPRQVPAPQRHDHHDQPLLRLQEALAALRHLPPPREVLLPEVDFHLAVRRREELHRVAVLQPQEERPQQAGRRLQEEQHQPQEEHRLREVLPLPEERQLLAGLHHGLHVHRGRPLPAVPAEVPRLPGELADAARRSKADRDLHPSTT